MASPIACVLAAQAVRQLIAGPRAPVRSARCDSGMFGSCSNSRMTFIARMASSAHFTESIAPLSAFQAVRAAVGEGVEIERAFAGAEVDADAVEVEGKC